MDDAQFHGGDPITGPAASGSFGHADADPRLSRRQSARGQIGRRCSRADPRSPDDIRSSGRLGVASVATDNRDTDRLAVTPTDALSRRPWSARRRRITRSRRPSETRKRRRRRILGTDQTPTTCSTRSSRASRVHQTFRRIVGRFKHVAPTCLGRVSSGGFAGHSAAPRVRRFGAVDAFDRPGVPSRG